MSPGFFIITSGRCQTPWLVGGSYGASRGEPFPLASLVVVLNERSETGLKQAVPRARVVQLPNMVEMDVVDAEAHRGRLPAVPAGAVRIVFVGHVLPTKGVQELIEACLRLECPPWALEVVGAADRSFQDRLRAAAAAAGELDRVCFHGTWTTRSMWFILASDLLVLPSYTEGAPNVVLEAMACGRPILAMRPSERFPRCSTSMDSSRVASACRLVMLAPCLVRWPPYCGTRHAAPNWAGGRARRVEEQYSIPVACRMVLSVWESLSAGSGGFGG